MMNTQTRAFNDRARAYAPAEVYDDRSHGVRVLVAMAPALLILSAATVLMLALL